MRVTNNYGVSEVVSLVMIVMIATTAIGTIVFWGVPMMESRKVFVRVDSALKQFEDINNVIKRVSSGGANTSEKIDFVTDSGQIGFGGGERFVLYYSIVDGFSFTVGGFDDEDDKSFNLQILSGTADEVDIYHLEYPYLNEYGINIQADGTVESNNPIIGAVRIDIYPIIGSPSHVFYGRIWVFDTACISYDVLTTEGTYSVIAENGAVVYASPYSSRVYDNPNLYYKNNLLVMHITNLKSQGYLIGSDIGRYNFMIKSNSSSVQENRVAIPGSFNMTIYRRENIVDAWVDYYKGEDFLLTNNFLPIYLEGPLNFTLVYSVCDVWIG